MPNAITIFQKNSHEYARLQAAAALLQAETGKRCEVNDIYFDFGQNWKWTTISIESGLKTFPFCQALNSRQQEDLIYGDLDTWYNTMKDLINHYKQ